MTFTLFSSNENLIVQFNRLVPEVWFEITAINDRDETGRLFGSELLLFEESRIAIAKIVEQFRDSPTVETNEFGTLYINYRNEEMTSHGPGFGRVAKVGLDDNGNIATIKIAWSEPGAGTPFVDRYSALRCLNYQKDETDNQDF